MPLPIGGRSLRCASLATAYRGGGYDPQIGFARYARAAYHADEAAALPPNTLRRLTPTPGIRMACSQLIRRPVRPAFHNTSSTYYTSERIKHVMLEKVVDPVLGDEGKVFHAGNIVWATFNKTFRPTGKRIAVLVDVTNGIVPETQRNLYTEIEKWFLNGLPEILELMLRRLGESDKTETKLPATNQIQDHFQLKAIDVRGHIPPSKCVLHFSTDLDDMDWYARISKDYQVEVCGPED
jgi:hypothetical protein